MEALVRSGFSDKDNIRSIRRSPRKVERFALLLESTADRWRARPSPPPGWPWAGKLAVLVESAGEPVPAELTGAGSEEEIPPELESLLDDDEDRKSTRLNSSHVAISYAVFCLKK